MKVVYSVFKLKLKCKVDVMGQRFVVLVLFVGLVGICFCGCENQGQKVERLIKELKHRKGGSCECGNGISANRNT